MLKFTTQGSVHVRLRKEGEDAVLEVADTGTGIPPNEVPRLFERFHRVEGSRGRTNEGSGIGLALVQELVNLHRGSVEATSQLGVGTQMRVRVPMGTAHIEPNRIRHESSAPYAASSSVPAYVHEALRWLPRADQSIVPPPKALLDAERDSRFAATSGSRVLLADDNADLRDYIREILQPLYLQGAARFLRENAWL